MIEHPDGMSMICVNQQLAPVIDGLFVAIGSYRFLAEKPAMIELRTEGTDVHVVADAVQLVPVDR